MQLPFLSKVARYPPGIRALFAGWLLSAFAYAMAMPFVTIFLRKERGASESTIGFVFLAMGLAATVAPVIAGVLTDRVGRRVFLWSVPAMRAAAYGALALAVHLEAPLVTISALLALTSFLGSFYQAVADTYVADIVPPAGRAEAYSVMRVGLNVGWMTGPAVGAFLSRTPWSLLFGITAALVAVNAVLMYAFCGESVRPGETGRAGPPLTPATTGLGACLRNRAFIGHCIFATVFFLCAAQLVTTLSLDALERVGLTQDRIGWLYALNGLVVILFQLPVNRFFAKVSLRRRLAQGAVLFGFAYWSLSAAGTFRGMLVAMALISFAEIIAYPVLVSIAAELAPPVAMGRYMGVYTMARSLARSLGPLIGMHLYAVLGTEPVAYWGIIGTFAVVAGAGFAAMPGGRGRAQASVEDGVPDASNRDDAS